MIKIDGLDRLIKKLDKLSRIETEKAIEEAGKEVEESIRNEAKTFSDTSYLYISRSDIRKYRMSCYIDIGLKNDDVPFDEWKGLWFHNWGYFNKGLKFNGEMYINPHYLWFNESVKSIEKDVQKKLKEKIRKEIKGALQ
ncbi:hypothetical protein [Clostridium baratii]|uniref:hypothetical protein n=1 Tax=Clostridium baratii TaxID=1561 RepID=UPI0030CF0C65